jgi:hypothetical protein
MSTTELMNEFEVAKKEIESIQKELSVKLQDTFKRMTVAVFDACPKLTGIVWAQYQNYWNDGEECLFSVNAPTFTNATDLETRDLVWGETDEEGTEEDPIWTAGENSWDEPEKGMPSEYAAIFTQFENMLQSSAMEDILRAMFGNHVKVVATREGFSVDEFEHD